MALTTLTTWLHALVADHGQGEALVEPGGTSVSFHELDRRVAGLAGTLRALGLTRGDRVASFLPNSIFQVTLLLAAARLGAVTIGVNTRYRSEDLRHLLACARPRLLVGESSFLGIDFPAVIDAAIDGLGGAPQVVWAHEVVSDLPTHAPVCSDDADATDYAVAFTTSGTTGRPKLAAHNHTSTVRHLRATASSMRVDPGVTGLLLLPFCGTFGFVSLLSVLAGGGRVVLPDHFDAAAAVDLVEGYGATHVNGSDDMLMSMLDRGRSLPTWRHGVQAEFAGRGNEVVTRAESAGIMLTGVYGSSETFALLARWSPDDAVSTRARIGGILADAANEVRAVDPHSGASLDTGQSGELQIRGPSVLGAYLDDDAIVPPPLTPDGWLPTGDLGFVDHDGGFVFLTRTTDALRLSGFLTDPVEIEQHLLAHPSVSGAQVVAGSKPGGGEVAIAFVLVAGDVDEHTLLEHCRRGLANYKVPARVMIVDSFPTVDGTNGVKIRKAALRDVATRLTSP